MQGLLLVAEGIVSHSLLTPIEFEEVQLKQSGTFLQKEN
jgi:hypothetical protein